MPKIAHPCDGVRYRVGRCGVRGMTAEEAWSRQLAIAAYSDDGTHVLLFAQRMRECYTVCTKEQRLSCKANPDQLCEAY